MKILKITAITIFTFISVNAFAGNNPCEGKWQGNIKIATARGKLLQNYRVSAISKSDVHNNILIIMTDNNKSEIYLYGSCNEDSASVQGATFRLEGYVIDNEILVSGSEVYNDAQIRLTRQSGRYKSS